MSEIDGGTIGGVKKISKFKAKNESLCLSCEYLSLERVDGKVICKAFPDGIPDRFISGKKQHIVPVKGDNGVTYSQRRKSRYVFGRGY